MVIVIDIVIDGHVMVDIPDVMRDCCSAYLHYWLLEVVDIILYG